jgi:CRP/FNR family transcriptional regulator, nitrogen oxide reductase regulator
MTHCDVPRPRPLARQVSSRLNWGNSEAQGAFVGESALLAGLSPQQCSEVFAYARITKFARNERLFSQDQPIHKLIMIRTGSVKLTQLSPDGKEVILWLNGPGDAVGMHADPDGGNHSCSAHAMERCQVFVWESQLLQMLISRYPRIQINLGKILARRLIELEERFCEIASERVPKRLALVLMRLLKSVGKQSREGIEVLITREELAQMTGTTLFTISRTLSKWANFGFVAPRREGVVIIDPDRLRRHAGLDEPSPTDCRRPRGMGHAHGIPQRTVSSN